MMNGYIKSIGTTWEFTDANEEALDYKVRGKTILESLLINDVLTTDQ